MGNSARQNKMKYIPTLTITNTAQLHALPLQKGQWIRLAWLDKPSRFHSASRHSVTAFHFPHAVSQFNSFCSFKRA